eukprot:CAMPEP_0196711378 /NCGR_PEP_ID=MMETSP1090-20130531/72239_1 /TAXON_ID=37098 /ORGANISM="Isochrysis sp, Strain CCMP1244" /LENGTH=117 /DNA_ID=CAMNT_0042051439 /DNA_START=107 /DNA_END=457 /DNA_ORIENTATION=+
MPTPHMPLAQRRPSGLSSRFARFAGPHRTIVVAASSAAGAIVITIPGLPQLVGGAQPAALRIALCHGLLKCDRRSVAGRTQHRRVGTGTWGRAHRGGQCVSHEILRVNTRKCAVAHH